MSSIVKFIILSFVLLHLVQAQFWGNSGTHYNDAFGSRNSGFGASSPFGSIGSYDSFGGGMRNFGQSNSFGGFGGRGFFRRRLAEDVKPEVGPAHEEVDIEEGPEARALHKKKGGYGAYSQPAYYPVYQPFHYYQSPMYQSCCPTPYLRMTSCQSSC